MVPGKTNKGGGKEKKGKEPAFLVPFSTQEQERGGGGRKERPEKKGGEREPVA